ncbi:hypothetical protein SAY86_007499 [Trapa natans]|uniref:Uncharacterized protein n=1 Tax=Trapa natans TaxID=22666 RepID=A0AAN7R0F6_TRANT|nr:hypothetical protein SAY86_007499 [Trapa natans]
MAISLRLVDVREAGKPFSLLLLAVADCYPDDNMDRTINMDTRGPDTRSDGSTLLVPGL